MKRHTVETDDSKQQTNLLLLSDCKAGMHFVDLCKGCKRVGLVVLIE